MVVIATERFESGPVRLGLRGGHECPTKRRGRTLGPMTNEKFEMRNGKWFSSDSSFIV